MPAYRRVLLTLVTVWLIAPAALAAARWPQWWSWIAPEQTPMTWLQSVALVLAAALSLLVGYTLGHVGERPAGPWWLLSAGFAALAVDERFAVHERIRDSVLAPRGIAVPFLPWVAPGDFLLLAVGVAGLALLPFVWRAFSLEPAARGPLIIGVLLASMAVAMDSIDPSTWTTDAERLEQTLEEVIEFGSGLALLASVTLCLLALLRTHLRTVSIGRPASGQDADAVGLRGDDGT